MSAEFKRGTHYIRRATETAARLRREELAAARGLPAEVAHLADVPTETLKAVADAARQARACDPGPRCGIAEQLARRLVGLDRCACATVQDHAAAAHPAAD